VRNSTVWAGVLGVEKSTVIDGVEFDDQDDAGGLHRPPASGREGPVRTLSTALFWL